MTREQVKPDWCKSKTLCGWWQTDIIDACSFCPDCKPKEQVLDDWIKPFFDNCCRMEKVNVGKR